MTCTLELKNFDVLNCHSKLQDVLLWVVKNVSHFALSNIVITSAYRPGDAGVHGQMPLRGLDIRCRDKWYGFFVQTMVNLHWQYDPQRPTMQCCVYHNVSPNVDGWHLHFQVHSNTQLLYPLSHILDPAKLAWPEA